VQGARIEAELASGRFLGTVGGNLGRVNGHEPSSSCGRRLTPNKKPSS
jgi:hypothetical protein